LFAASLRSRPETMLYRSNTARVLWPLMAIATRSGTPARTRFRIPVRRKSWNRSPSTPARSQADFQALRAANALAVAHENECKKILAVLPGCPGCETLLRIKAAGGLAGCRFRNHFVSLRIGQGIVLADWVAVGANGFHGLSPAPGVHQLQNSMNVIPHGKF
jgi:hypothetical protein